MVAISEVMANSYGLGVGDRLPLSLRTNDDAPQFYLQIAGIVRPLDAQDPFWFGQFSPLRPKSDARFASQMSALLPQDSFFELSERWFSPSDVTLQWYLQLDPSQIDTAELPQLQSLFNELEEENWRVGESGIRIETEMHETLQAFVVQSTAVRAPLIALTATMVLSALYYVIMTASLSLQHLQREFAILRGRGSSAGQIFRLQLQESTLLTLIAVASGPGLAWLFVSALSRMGPLADVRQAEWVLRLPTAAWLAAAVGGIACIFSLIFPLPSVLRRSIVTYQSTISRGEQTAWWQRYYVDVFILLAGLILLWRVRTNGGIIGGNAIQPRVDWLLLIAPLALMLGARQFCWADI